MTQAAAGNLTKNQANNGEGLAGLGFQLSPRFLLGLVGAIVLVGGVWHADRSWDEKGSAAYKAAKAKGVPLSKEAIDASFPFPWAFLLGWALYAAAYGFPASSTDIELTTPGMFASGFCVALSIIASIPMAYAVKNRKATLKKLLGLSFVLSWLGLTVSTTLSTGNGAATAIPCALGAFSIVASMKILWKYRTVWKSTSAL